MLRQKWCPKHIAQRRRIACSFLSSTKAELMSQTHWSAASHCMFLSIKYEGRNDAPNTLLSGVALHVPFYQVRRQKWCLKHIDQRCHITCPFLPSAKVEMMSQTHWSAVSHYMSLSTKCKGRKDVPNTVSFDRQIFCPILLWFNMFCYADTWIGTNIQPNSSAPNFLYLYTLLNLILTPTWIVCDLVLAFWRVTDSS